MSPRKLILVVAICLTAPIVARAQSTAANPVVASAREIFERQVKFIAAAADEMPADKYSYHPMPDQWSFGKIVSHVATVDFLVCSMISGTPMPQNEKVTETDSKEKMASALQASFDFCSKALTNLQDSQLGDTVKFFGGREAPRARALFELTGDLEDHYSQLAGYLRLNGMLPPSAKPRK
jgi:uncharacterized damage-inducible protein DinB